MKIKFKEFLKTSVSLLVILSLCLSMIVYAATEDEPWDTHYAHESAMMPFTPAEGYISQQNPPSFKWGYVKDANAYELVIASDAELKDVKYKKSDIEFNYHIPSTTFETGVFLYWSVRYKINKNWSTWSQVRKFRIDPDAIENPMPPVNEIMARVPESHPRIWLRPEELETFRSYKDTNKTSKAIYDGVISRAETYLEDRIIQKEPERKTSFANTTEQQQYTQTIASLCLDNNTRANTCGYAYLLSGDERYGRYAAELLLEYCKWDYKKGISSYESQDQVHRAIALGIAMVYDWIYPVLTDAEKKEILEHITGRMESMKHLLNTLDVNPYDSHGWTCIGYIGIIAVATYREIPAAEEWLTKIVQLYPSLLPVWTYEDGGWAQGTGYAQYSRLYTHEFLRVLAAAGIINLYNNAYIQNEYLWDLYADSFFSVGSFGDEAYRMGGAKDGSYTRLDLMHDIHFMEGSELNGIRKWIVEKNGGIYSSNDVTYWMAPSYDAVETTQPATYQLANEYHDIGWVNMTDDLASPEAILLTFKSSPFGSFNHSHADQNSFFIQAYGDALAIKSGYYDSYHSVHDSGFTRKTGAHNTVTVATNKGQRDDDITAKGKLTGYLTQVDFDLAKGDATESYKGNLGKFERAIVYIRPDMFVVVDDLKASETEKTSKFEWWLNAENDIKLYEEGNGARIKENDAVLDAIVQYPQNVKSFYTDKHELSDMKEINPTVRFQEANVQKRVWFQTDKVKETKMIVTLDVHRETREARYVDTEYFDNYVKMTFENGTRMFVNLGESTDEVVTKDGFTFTGQIVVLNDESIMLVDGTSLKQGETELITLEKEASVVMGKDELSISSYSDNRISVNKNNRFVKSLTSVTDYKGRELSSAIGITGEAGKLVKTADATEKVKAVYEIKEADDYTTFNCEADNYQLLLNGKVMTNELYETTIKVTVDGVVSDVKLNGYKRRDGKIVYNGKLTVVPARYKILGKSEGLTVNSLEPGAVAALGTINLETYEVDGQFIEIEKIPVKTVPTRTEEDFDAVKESLAVLVEAESFIGKAAKNASVYTHRAFLSGGAGVQLFSSPGTQMNYEFEVKEEGDYNVAVKYVAWDEGGATRSFVLNGKEYSFVMEKTESWGSTPEEWRVSVVEESIHLMPGKYMLTLEAISGNWNYDWIGIIKK